MSFEQIVSAGERSIDLFMEGRDAAAKRLQGARNMCDAVAGQDMAVQAEATIDMENAISVASEWGLIRQSPGVKKRGPR